MAELTKGIGDIPVNIDNEALIIANAIKNERNREIFVRLVDFMEFRMREFQTMAYAIQAIENEKLDMNIDAIMIKSKTCPIRYYLDYKVIEELLTNFNEVSENNFIEHINRLKIDNVKASIADRIFSSLYASVMDPASDLAAIEERLRSMQEIVETGFSASRCGFKTMDEVMTDMIEERKQGAFHRTTGFRSLDTELTDGLKDGQVSVICGLPSMGKCLKINTRVLMYDGTFKKVQDIVIGDLLMGPDSNPRKVLNITTGKDKLYRIRQKRGDDYFVNKEHILSLKRIGHTIYTRRNSKSGCRRGEILNISVKDALLKPKNFFKRYNGYRVPIAFTGKDINLDPYFLGIWLADGNNSNQRISNPDREIHTFLKDYARTLNMKYSKYEYKHSNKKRCPSVGIIRQSATDSNILLDTLRNYNLLGNKHIPHVYKINSMSIRLQLLAGLLDGDGYLSGKGTYEITSKYKKLADDIVFLSRSLGFYTSIRKVEKGIKSLNFKSMYYKIYISGDTYQIPCKVKRKKAQKINRKNNLLNCRISIEEYKEEKYFGFELDNNGLFLLEDFTVTHNSSFALSMMKNLANKGVYTAQFALEMPNMSLAKKLLAFNTRWTIKEIAGNWENLSAEQKTILDYEIERLRKNEKIHLNDKPTQTLPEIREQIMLLQDKLQTTYVVVVIDLFGKIKEFQGSDNFARDYEQKLNDVQVMTRTLGVHMSLVAQINRTVASRKNPRPRMSDLKNAGAWEEVADLVFAIHRENYRPDVALQTQATYGQQSNAIINPDDNIAELLILKARMAQNNRIVYFYFDPITTRFAPIDPSYSEELKMRFHYSGME